MFLLGREWLFHSFTCLYGKIVPIWQGWNEIIDVKLYELLYCNPLLLVTAHLSRDSSFLKL